ncbi:hypothetical protein L195_g062336, partial [Trifolium pratense]
MINN